MTFRTAFLCLPNGVRLSMAHRRRYVASRYLPDTSEGFVVFSTDDSAVAYRKMAGLVRRSGVATHLLLVDTVAGVVLADWAGECLTDSHPVWFNFPMMKNTTTEIWTVEHVTEGHPVLGTTERELVRSADGKQIGTTPAGKAISICEIGLMTGSVKSARYNSNGDIEVVLDSKAWSK